MRLNDIDYVFLNEFFSFPSPVRCQQLAVKFKGFFFYLSHANAFIQSKLFPYYNSKHSGLNLPEFLATILES